MALQALIKGLQHKEKKGLSPTQLRVLTAVELCIKVMKVIPNVEQIATFARLRSDRFETELAVLVDLRYLTEIVNPYGKLALTYKIGPLGGTALKAILDRKPKKVA